MTYDYLIVGSGFTGATLAERLKNITNKKIIVVDKRYHIGGNCFDYYNEDGILISKYGAHIFHTKSNKIWNYINKFAEFNQYVHKVGAYYKNEIFPLPLNLETINHFFNMHLTEAELPSFLETKRVFITNPINAEEAIISRVGWELYDAFYKNYTQKQWGIDPKKLSPSVTLRLPIRYNNDNRYFDDKWQGIPKNGYTELFKKMLNGIEVILNTNYQDILDLIKFDKLIFTGPIDSYFSYMYGKLPYRSLEFKFQTYNKQYFQKLSVINYPNDFNYTRCVEYKYLNMQKTDKTTVSYEFPCWNEDEPYYPVPMEQNHEILRKYNLATSKLKTVFFAGRLGKYRYYNMDQCIGEALSLFDNLNTQYEKRYEEQYSK